MNTATKLSICAAGLFAAVQTQAAVYDFSDGSYTNGPLNGQNGFYAETGNVINNGTLVMAQTNEWSVAMPTAGMSQTNNHYTISSWFSFYQTGPRTTKQEIHRVMLNDALGGSTPISGILRRAAAGKYVLQTKTDQPGSAANQGWHVFDSSALGLTGDDPGQSDNLLLTITFERGATADEWNSTAVLSNLTAGTMVTKDERLGVFNVTTNLHDAATVYGGISSSQLQDGAGVSNKVVTMMEVNGYYITPPTFDTVFDYDFEGWSDATELGASTPGWDNLNQWGMAFSHTNAAGSRLVHRPASTNAEFFTASAQPRKGWNWRGEIFTNGLGRVVEPGESIEFSTEYTMFSHTQASTRNGLDFFFTTNGVSVAGATGQHAPSQQSFGTYPDGQMGFRTRQLNWNTTGGWPDGGFGLSIDPANPDAVPNELAVSLNTIGITNIAGGAAADIVSDPMRITYTALKTTNSGIWNVSVAIEDLNGATIKSHSLTVTNQALYDATNIYFGMYAYHGAAGEEGAELDNMHCRINYIDLTSLPLWDQYMAAYGLTNGPTGDQDIDGESNWHEYVFGGDPTNSAVLGIPPAADGTAGNYAFSIRGDNTLKYSILTTGNLVLGPWTTNGPMPVTELDGAVHVKTAPFGAGNQEFMKLIVQ